MSRKLKIGILGCGPRGREMARITKLVPECCELVAMSDPAEKARLAASEISPDIKFFESSDDLLNSGLVEAVITETPPQYHTDCVIKALERNLHVLAEIPAVETLEEGLLLWEKVNQSSALYMGGATPQYRSKTPFVLKLKEMDLLGKIAYIETEYVHGSGEKITTNSWRNNYESCRYCTHSLGPVLKLIGEEFTAVSCMSTYDRLGNGRAHNAMSALLHTKSNIVVRLLTVFGLPTHGPRHTTRIMAEKGIVYLYNEKADIWLKGLNEFSAKNDFIEIPFTPDRDSRPANLIIHNEEMFREASYGHNGSDIYMLRDFADAVLNNKPSPVNVREMLAMTLPGIYAAESAGNGGALKEIKYPWDM